MSHKFKITGGRCVKTPLGMWATIFSTWTCEKCGEQRHIVNGQQQSNEPSCSESSKTFIIEEKDELGEIFTYILCGELADAETFVKEHEEDSRRWKLNRNYRIRTPE